MKLTIRFDRSQNCHVVKAHEGEDGTSREVARIFGWVEGGTPSIKVPYFLPMDALSEIENAIQREGSGSRSEDTYIEIGAKA